MCRYVTLKQKTVENQPIYIPIAVTADVMTEDREKCLAAGMNDYISKPIKREIIFRMVKKWARGINGI
jgi:CheY-like chemotaxis protein